MTYQVQQYAAYLCYDQERCARRELLLVNPDLGTLDCFRLY